MGFGDKCKNVKGVDVALKWNVLFTAMGSIGSRHLKNLSNIFEKNGDTLCVDVIRKTSRQLPEDIKCLVNREIYNINDIESYYDVIFITGITSEHFDEILFYKNHTKYLFIEKPIFESLNYPLEKIMPGDEDLYYVATPMRYTPVYKRLQEIVAEKTIFAARIICSSYMPDWQKGRDYRKSFRTKNDQGGGVDIDLIHEIDYMIGLFGMPEEVNRMAGKYSDLEMEACDIANYLFRYQNMLAEVHLDYFGRKDQRYIELYTADDVIVGDYMEKKIKYLASGKEEIFDKSIDHYYLEMDSFVKMIKEKNEALNINTVMNAIDVLKWTKGEC